MDKIFVERIRDDLVIENNTNNHEKDPTDTEVAGLDYETELKKTNLMNYADLINYPVEWSYTFTDEEKKILIKCASDCIKIGRSALFEEELKPIVERLESGWTNGMWFFRFNSMSPKDGEPEYPVFDAKQVVNKIVTSKRGWNCMLKGENTIYFVKYDSDWDLRREFRVFVYKRKVTAISQYNVSIKSMLSGKSTAEAKELSFNIKTYLEERILPSICTAIRTDNLVCDIYVNTDLSLRIVEFNSFGYWQAAGSSLFHWINDKDKLYNTDDKTFMRFIK